MNSWKVPLRVLKRILSKPFFALFRRYVFDVQYDDKLANIIAPAIKKFADKKYFELWQKNGVHITPNHFYQPIPDTRELPETLWGKDKECYGIDFQEQKQLSFLNDIIPKYLKECKFPKQPPCNSHEFYLGNGTFEAVDAEVLHCFIRHFKPGHIIEIGVGFSTLILASASRLNANEGINTQLRIIDPYPNSTLVDGRHGIDDIVISKVESLSPEYFDVLNENDILFIDSSHVVKIGGDVNYNFFKILPRLKPGVIIHFHDIYLPEEYPRDLAFQHRWFWSEQYLLHAFLMHNSDYEVLFAGNYMRTFHQGVLASIIDSYEYGKTIPASFWIRKIR